MGEQLYRIKLIGYKTENKQSVGLLFIVYGDAPDCVPYDITSVRLTSLVCGFHREQLLFTHIDRTFLGHGDNPLESFI